MATVELPAFTVETSADFQPGDTAADFSEPVGATDTSPAGASVAEGLRALLDGAADEEERFQSLLDSGFDGHFEATPAKFQILQYDSPDKLLVAQANPTEFQDDIEIEWNRFTAPGGSYAHMHYNATKNYTVTIDLYFRASTPDERKECEFARHLLWSWCYPDRAHLNGVRQGPPQLIATWPKVFSMKCYLISLSMNNLRFSTAGRVTRWEASLKLEECRDAFIGANDVSDVKAIRGSDYWRKSGGG